MTEHDLLAEMNAGLLIVNPDTLEVRRYVPSRKRWEVKAVDPCPRTGRARFKFGSPRRVTVQRNRLVFIWTHRYVPAGVVDHRDGDRTNDRPDNLREQPRAESDRQGYDRLVEKNLKELLAYFESVAVVPW